MNLFSDFCFSPGDFGSGLEGGQNIQLKSAGDWAGGESQDSQRGNYLEQNRSLSFSRQVKGLHLAGKSVILTPAGLPAMTAIDVAIKIGPTHH